MEMIKCPDCGREYEDMLDACPECGCPKVVTGMAPNTVNNYPLSQGGEKRKGYGILIAILIVLSVAIIASVSIFLIWRSKNKKVKSVAIGEGRNELQVGEELDLTYTISPEDAKIKDVSWKSTDAAVASVQDGHVTTHASGSCNIVLTINSEVTAEYPITVISKEEQQREAVGKLVAYVESHCDAKSDGVSMIYVRAIDSENDFYIGCKGGSIYLISENEPKENTDDLFCKYNTYVVIDPGNLKSASFKQSNSIDVYGYKATTTGDGKIEFDKYKLGDTVKIDSFKSSLDSTYETSITNEFQKLANNGVKNGLTQLKQYLEDNKEIGCTIEDLQLQDVYNK